ncbi:unnamed protein product [Linum tenue]|uniref:RING-type E3 ubiquitin transferase n=1 Tax=Linum tenue TaxID=586396 RepID=A0AAV0HWQ2_9ROSI|nr:unnamed protein product [Linum tenue]
MNTPPPLKLHHLWLKLMTTLVLPLCFSTFTVSWSNEFDSPSDHYNPSLTTTYTYNRFTEIQHRCGDGGGRRSSSTLLPTSSPLLSPLASDDDRGSRIRNELSFVSGDWVQEFDGGSPLPQLSAHHDPLSTSLFKLASFQVTDVDSVRRSNDMVSVSGRLVLSLTDGPGFRYRAQSDDGGFGRSSMGSDGFSVHLEGVYFEVNGERVMCFLGNASMPSSPSMNGLNTDLAYRRKSRGCNCEGENNQQAPLVQNDQIMLVLRYPKVFTFSSRGVFGEMMSFGNKDKGNYFDKVYISSQLSSTTSKYQFSADEQLLSEVCSSNSNRDKVKLYEGDGFCHTLKDMLNNEVLDLVVQSTGSSTNQSSSSKLGPFVLESSSMATNAPLGLLIHHVQCQQHDDGNVKAAKVAAVLRIVPSSDRFGTSRGRTGLSTMTLSAEGIWRSGQELCMVACVGSNTKHRNSSTSRSCNSRVCLSIPLELSIKERRLLFASVSSNTGDSETEFHPLLFEKPASRVEICLTRSLRRGGGASKMGTGGVVSVEEEAGGVVSAEEEAPGEPPCTGEVASVEEGVPPLEDGDKMDSSGGGSCDNELGDDEGAVHEKKLMKASVELEILSLGSFVRGDDQQRNHQRVHKEEEEEEDTIEVSGLLKLEASNSISLSLEGIYNKLTGEMHLVGCRDIRNISSSIEEGMDCEYEIRVEYPSTNIRWMLNPKARISIHSRRDSSDPFHFPSISLTTHPIPYMNEHDDMRYRATFETTLRVLMLTSAVVLILRQVSYMETTTNIAAYVSVVTLGIQAMGYGIPLLTSTEAMFPWKVFSPHPRTHVEPNFSIKILLFVALLLTLKLSNKVKLSRGLSRDNGRALNRRDLRALFITLAILAAGILFLQTFPVSTNPAAAQAFKPADHYFPEEKTMHRSRSEVMPTTTMDALGIDYDGIVQDLFLVPQVIGNALWKLQGSSNGGSKRALTGSYYIGFTVLRVLIKVYECVRDPVLYGKEMAYGETAATMEDYSGNLISNMVVAAGVIAVAVVVHLQQKGGDDEDQQKVDRKGKGWW